MLEACRAHRIQHVAMHPRLLNFISDRIVEKDPGRVINDDSFGLIVDGVAAREIAERSGLGEERIDARVAEEGIVVRTPLLAREQHVEKVRGSGKSASQPEKKSGTVCGWRMASRNGGNATAFSIR